MRPPGGQTATPDRATSPAPERSSEFLSPRVVAREAVKILTAAGHEIRPAMVRKLVHRFITEGHTSTKELEPYLLHYFDPTGESAVHNVMKGRDRKW